MAFTHLHVHTEFSLLDGSSKIKELVAQVKNLGMDSIAITDHGVMYGVIDFYKAAKSVGIKPIIGCEVYVSPNSRFDREIVKGEDRYYHLVLLAENDIGYHNLTKIVSTGFVEGFYYKPRVDMEVLKQYSEGIIALSACLAGEVAVLVRKGFYEEAKDAACKYRDIFGADNYFLELQDHGIGEQTVVNTGLIKMSQELNIPLVATNDIHYVNAEDVDAHDILLCIQTNRKVADEDRMRYEGGQYYLKSEEEMKALFPYALEALENTHKIAQRCNVEIVFGEQKVPEFSVPEGYDAVSYLTKLCEEGIKERYNPLTKELTDRLYFEIDTIKQMGYVDYFLIVWDFIKYARDNGIAVGPGRGSAAGSIVSYCLGITNIDPIKYNLLFERFLNPERISMPDIDIDFCVVRRQEVIDYVVEKYGKDKVVQIVTFGTMAARSVIRDVGRALDLPYSVCDAVAKMIPTDVGMTIERAMEVSKDLKNIYDNDEEVKYLVNMSKRLEGLARNTGMHAAGVVIGKESIDEYVPLARGSEESIVTQFTMTTIEELGLLKMDFLGLRNLTVIQNAVAYIVRRTGIDLDIDKINYNDKRVFELIASGRTEGIFQLESSGMKSFMKELKPGNLEDIIAGISLYRPGPMDFIPFYIRGKEHPENIKYDCPELEEILAPTYGCIVYQEQVMQIVMELAGYTLGRSDLVRRAMSKKKAEVMEKERKNFVYGNELENVPGCIARGISEAVANKIFDDMTDFAKYAFNKSHAAAYAVVAYQTAYLKCFYPVEFMAALISSVKDNSGKVSEYIMHCRQMGIVILPPDINEGYGDFSVKDGCIRYGLSALKNVGYTVINSLVEERDARGKFKDLYDFIHRCSEKTLNKRSIENFIKGGALDSLGANRKQMMQVYASILDRINNDKKHNIAGQMNLFDIAGDDCDQFNIVYPDVEEYSKTELLFNEKEVLGIYISGHPLEEYLDVIEKYTDANTLDFLVDEETGKAKVRDQVIYRIGGMISAKTVKTTKNNQNMAFLLIEDLVGSVEVIVFPRDYERYKNVLILDKKLIIKGRATVSEEVGKLILETIVPMEDFQVTVEKKLFLQYVDKESFDKNDNLLYEIIEEYPGTDKVMIYLAKEKAYKPLENKFGITITSELVEKIEKLLGSNNVKVVEKTIDNLSRMN